MGGMATLDVAMIQSCQIRPPPGIAPNARTSDNIILLRTCRPGVQLPQPHHPRSYTTANPPPATPVKSCYSAQPPAPPPLNPTAQQRLVALPTAYSDPCHLRPDPAETIFARKSDNII